MSATRSREGAQLGVIQGSALYVGALVGPGLLLIPALAVRTAGPASIVAWLALIILSAPLAVTFAALGTRFPVAEGIAAYVRAGLGNAAGAITGGWFAATPLFGAAAVAMIGGYYVSDLTMTGTGTAVTTAALMFAGVLAVNLAGLRISAAAQIVIASVLVGVLVMAMAVALPARNGMNWQPFTPHGWWAVGTAASILVWLFVGWEAVAQLAGDFRRPEVDLPRAIWLAFCVVTILYIALAVTTVEVNGHSSTNVPLADIVSVGFGRVGRILTALVAVALTMGTMNVYTASCAKLAAALSDAGVIPKWLAKSDNRTVPRRPLLSYGAVGIIGIFAVGGGLLHTTDLVRAASSLFVCVYLFVVISAVRLFRGRTRLAALAATVIVLIIVLFSGWYIGIPAVVAALTLIQVGSSRWRSRIRAKALTTVTDVDS